MNQLLHLFLCRSCSLRRLILTALALSITTAAESSSPPAPGPPAEPSPPRYEVRRTEVFIPMPDGVRLAADLVLPEGAAGGEQRFPALFLYLPYRKDEALGSYWGEYAYFARRGYAVARVDVRGTGRSEGRLPPFEYSDQELEDGMIVVDWLSRQPWSNGKVGMFGRSWGGFNAIQIATRRPPALAAIMAGVAAEDLFEDDVHYIDGLMHVDQYEIAQDLDNARGPPPDFPLDDHSLRLRFDTEPWLLVYLRHQRDGPFWDRASLAPDYQRLQVPTLLVGGWYDGYRDAVPRLLANVPAPVKAIVGPWSHGGAPGPLIELRHEMVRWFDYWLKGRDTGVLSEPPLAVYVRRWHPPDPNLAEIPGDWRYEDAWPPARGTVRTLHLQPDRTLSQMPAGQGEHALRYVPSAGGAAGFWWGDLRGDQRPADAFSLVYDTAPLEEEIEILGLPRAHLEVAADVPLAHWFARLSDVAPGGSVTLVTGAGLNGAHRVSAEEPRPLEPGRFERLSIEMHFTSWVFPRGHRIRLAVSNALWPMIWPTPYPMTTRLRTGGEDASRLELPVVAPAERPRPVFLAPQADETLAGYADTGSGWPGTWRTVRDEVRRESTVEWEGSYQSRFPWGLLVHRESITYHVADARPEAASLRSTMETSVTLKDQLLTWRGILDLRSDPESFHYRYTRQLFRDGKPIRERTWKESVARDHQ